MEIKEIELLIDEKKYYEAIKALDNKIDEVGINLHNDENYSKYKKLLRLRVFANALQDKNDDIIRTVARKERFPFRTKVDFGRGNFVTLIDQDIFFIKSDAYINAIHKEHYFHNDKKSFSYSLSERIDADDIRSQMLKQQNNFFIKLKHENLSAPQSFHLPIIEDDGIINFDGLRQSVKELFLFLTKIKLKSFVFVALGASTIKSEDQHTKAIEIVADELDRFFNNKPNNYNPLISFSFVNYKSLKRYEDIFERKTRIGRYIETKKQELYELQKKMCTIANTINKRYQNQLETLSYNIEKKESVILLLGESGVGKSYIAKHIIHDLSSRIDEPFEHINCSAFTPQLLYVELFGTEEGCYSDAKERAGIFERAKEGTVFLDEIGFADIVTQKTLLTFLDTRKFKRLCGEKEIESNCKIIFGTDQDLEDLIFKGHFIKPLYERISNDRKIIIPPIRERIEDIDLIVSSSLDILDNSLIEIDEKTQVPQKKAYIQIGITESAKKIIREFPWPGNYRQLYMSLRKWYEDALYFGKTNIDIEVINNNPPRISFFDDNKIGLLENLIGNYMKDWDYDKNGKFRDEFIHPILAKVFLKDLKLPKTLSNKYLGFDGTHSKKGIDVIYEKYETKVKKHVK